MNAYEETFSFSVTSLMLLGIVLLPWVTLVLSEVLLWLYRRAVDSAMHASFAPAAAPLPDAASRESPRGRVELEMVTSGAAAPGDDAGLYEQFRRTTTSALAIYACAGIVCAIVMAAALGMRFGALAPVTLTFLAIAYAWPAVFTACVIRAPRLRWLALAWTAYLALFMTALAVPRPAGALLAIFFANVGATFIAVVVRARRIRAVAPLVAAFLALLGVAVTSIIVFAAAMEGRIQGSLTGVGALEPFLFLGAILLLLAAGPVLGWLALVGIARWYARKGTSDQAMTLGAIWLIFADLQAATFAYDDLRWMLVGAAAFAAFLMVAAAGFRMRAGRAPQGAAPRLLVLRVFALGSRSRKLFDAVTARWRYIGSVQLIAGPDLARSTVEPHEFLDFVRRRLGARFLETPASIDAAIDRLDLERDPDGRFRITDFFCRDSAWQAVFGRLAARSDVVLMDLRGYSPQSQGCTYELASLLHAVPLERVTIVVDAGTETLEYLRDTLERAAGGLPPGSPNAGESPLRVRVFRETGWRGLDPDRLFRLLCASAERSHTSAAVVA